MSCWPLLFILFANPAAQLERSCTGCHQVDVIQRQRLARWEWSRELDKMAIMGAQIGDRKEMLDYLAKNFGNRKPRKAVLQFQR